jgi:hypothetical protein
MERRALVGMVVLAAVGAGLAVGCQTEKRKNNPYMSEMGKQITYGDLPAEVQEVVHDSYPNAQVNEIYEMRHRTDYHMRHFEIHLTLADGRRKTFEYNTFQKPSAGVRTLESQEVQGSGTSPGAQPRGELEGKGK